MDADSIMIGDTAILVLLQAKEAKMCFGETAACSCGITRHPRIKRFSGARRKSLVGSDSNGFTSEG
ncbi:MAG: hypothetical protein K9M08_02255 [Pirellula sp.]|nr:hypothetical protein [Pirellula sp.]